MADRKTRRFDFDRHTPGYRRQFPDITAEMQDRCPVAWSETYGGHFVAAGHHEVFEIARAAEYVSNEYKPEKGRLGILVPGPELRNGAGFLEMDPPRQRHYRQALNPYLSPAAIARWVPVVDEVVRACLDERIESGRIDFVDDLANIVPAVMTMGLLGAPLSTYEMYVEPTHASVYTRPDSPEMAGIRRKQQAMLDEMAARFGKIKADGGPPGLIHALVNATVDGGTPSDRELIGVIGLIIGGGFDTTTALTAHAVEWLGEHPSERIRLSENRDSLLDSATEEFLRYYTPAVGDGRTITASCEIAGQEFAEGDRIWVSWAMANRDPAVFENPGEIDLARTGNRHLGFGIGLHRCIGSNVARVVFKRMLLGVLDRLPDYRCDAEGTVHYGTIGVINGMRHLPATFTPGPRLGPGLEETIAALQERVDAEGIAGPVVRGALVTALPDGPPPAAGVITGRRELIVWRSGTPELVARVEQYPGRAVATPHGILVLGPRTAALVRPDGSQALLATVPDPKIALSDDRRRAAIAGVDLRAKPKYMLWTIDLADGSVSGEEHPALPRAVLPGSPPEWPGPRVGAALAGGDAFVLTDAEGEPLTASGMRFGPYLSPDRRWLYGFRQRPPVLTVTEVNGDELGSPVTWPLPPGCATASGGNRCPVWKDGRHLLLITPHGTVPGTRAIRVDVTTGAIERTDVGPHSDAEVFVEPQPVLPKEHP